jgi:hypothetical protein
VDLREPDQLRYFREVSNTMPASSVVYRRAVMERVGTWPEDLDRRGDRVLWARILDDAGDGGLAFLSEVTTLHFIADWRQGPTWGAFPFDAWLPTVRPEAWPHALQVAVAAGQTEQAAVWEAMSADPAWTASLRAATGTAIDRLAWAGALALRERRELERDLLQAGRESEGLALELDRLRTRTGATRSHGSGPLAPLTEPGGLPRGVAAMPRRVRERARVATSRSATASAVVLAVRARVRNPLFDAAWYRQRYPDVPRDPLRAWRHWRRHGWREGRQPNAVFDAEWYLSRYPDVRAAGLDPLEHYLRWGAAVGRDPGPTFDASWYLEQYPDVADSGMNAVWHYLRHGSREGRETRPVGMSLASGAAARGGSR